MGNCFSIKRKILQDFRLNKEHFLHIGYQQNSSHKVRKESVRFDGEKKDYLSLLIVQIR